MIRARRLPLDFGPISELGLRAVLVVLTLLAVAGLYDRPLALSALAVGVGAVVAMSVEQRLVIPIIVLLLPLEIGARVIPILETDQTARLGASALNLARLGILLGAALWTVRASSEWWREFPRSSLYLPLFLLLGLYVFSLGNTEDFKDAAEEVARLVIHLAFFLLIALHVRDRQALRWVVLALVGSGLVLALIGIFQQLTDTYFWNEEALARLGIRRNATFVNSNYYARFLVITIVMSTALLFTAKPRVRYLLVAACVLATLALPFTSSRSSWLTAAALLPLVMLMLPISPRGKASVLALGASGALALSLIVAALEPALADRITTMASDIETRSYLVRAGCQMFLDHPLFGVGLASYTQELQGPYSHFISGSSVTSHTAVITVMAELGILGLTVLALLLWRFGRLAWRLYDAGNLEDKALVAGLVGAFLAIFVLSQSGARFFEDPYLWLFLGLVAALARIRHSEAERERTQIGIANEQRGS